MRFEPKRIRAKIDFTRPFKAASTVADTYLCKYRRIANGGKDTLADQMIEAIERRLAIGPSHPNGIAIFIGDRTGDNIIKHLRHI